MKKSLYFDIPCICQIIGSVYNKPELFSDERYSFNKEDFYDSFHQLIFSTIYNVYQLSKGNVNLQTIEDYLSRRPKLLAEYNNSKGADYILKCAEAADIDSFNYYFSRLKKFTLLRQYEKIGMDLSWFLDLNNVFDAKKKKEQEDRFDEMELDQIATLISDKVELIKINYTHSVESQSARLGDGSLELLEDLKKTPSLGYPFFTDYMNTITRGARLGKFYLRSAPTGVGKSRTMIGDACFIGCSKMWDSNKQEWISIGAAQPTLYIATEQDLEEVTTMAIAFISGIDEDHILKNDYLEGEWERAKEASNILKKGKVFFECIPDFGLEDIETLIKKHIRKNEVQYVFFDYIHSSAKILTEVGGKSGVKNLREDNVLFLLSSKLKDICVQYNIFILSSTQLNSAYQDTDTPDQNCLRGSKAIADRLDVGMIMLDVTPADEEKIKRLCDKNGGTVPNVKISVYKNRQNRYKGVYLWCYANKGTCRFEGGFMTDWNYNLISAENLKIKVEEESLF